MAISVDPKSVSLKIKTKPAVDPPSVSGTTMQFTCKTDLEAGGECQLIGDAGDNPADFTLGLIQMEWIETNWGHYRGHAGPDGSSFLQRARPPARPKQGCRDTLTVGDVFVDNNPGKDKTTIVTGTALPAKMTAAFFDGPNETYDLTRTNTKTKKLNYLREVQLEFHFCTVLSLRSPTKTFQHLKHFLWNVHWQARFEPTDYSNLSAAWTITLVGGKLGNTANVSQIADGGPTDKRFLSIITAATAPNCNQVAGNASKSPNVQESDKWDNFVVTK